MASKSSASPKGVKNRRKPSQEDVVGPEENEDVGIEEKLAQIDHEIRTLHQFCINKGYNPWQVEKSAQPIFEVVSKHRREKWLRRLAKLGIFVVLAVLLVHFDPAYRLMCSYGKRASMQVSWPTLFY